MSALPPVRPAWPALLGIPALALAAAAQAALEGSLHDGPGVPLPRAVWLSVPALLLAAVALWKRDDPRRLGAGRLSLAPVPWAWFAACLPGAACFAAALALHLRADHFPAHPATAALWLAGVLLVLAPGVAHAWKTRRERPAPPEGLSRRRVALMAFVLFGVAMALRTWGGLERIPAWVENDEATTGLDARTDFGKEPWAIFGFWHMGMPKAALATPWLVLKIFGNDLHGLRLGAAVLGALSIVLFFDAARRLVGAPLALAAGLLVAVNHVHVHWSRVGQVYIETPFFGMLALALLTRAFTGGSFLSVVGAGVALGIGAPTYQPSQILPPVLLLTGLGWALAGRLPWRRAVATLAFVGGLAALMVAPAAATLLRLPADQTLRRVGDITLFSRANLAELARQYSLPADATGAVVAEHAKRTLALFNRASDWFPSYGADRAMADPATAALLPVAFGLLLFRMARPAAWMSFVFTGAFLGGGVLLAGHPTTYHRVAITLFFTSLAVVWLVGELAAAAGGALGLPRRGAAASATALLVLVSAVLNARYYFRESPRVTRLDDKMALGFLVCRYAGTRTVIDATTLDGEEYVPLHNVFPAFQCPSLERVWCRSRAELWNVPRFTNAERAVLVVPEQVVNETPGTPAGYRIVRTYVDRSGELPVPRALRVYELDRAEAARAPGTVAAPPSDPLH